MVVRNGQTMEKERGHRGTLHPEERELARQIFGNLPESELAVAFLAACAEVRIERFGSDEAAEEHYARMRELETELIADHQALERRVKGL